MSNAPKLKVVKSDTDRKLPKRFPRPLEGVLFFFSDSNLVGGEIVTLPMIVTSVVGEGIVNGYLVLDPSAVIAGPDGKPKSVIEYMRDDPRFTPFIPVQNSPYGTSMDRNTWCFFEDQYAPRRLMSGEDFAAAIKGKPND